MNFALLQKFCKASGIPGAEEPIKKLFLEAIQELVDEIEEDALGNILLHKKGKGPKILLDAHLDEVAFLVAGFEGPFLRVLPLGGLDPRTIYGQRLIVWGKRPLSAVVATRPPHLGEEKKVPSIEEMLLDVGLSEKKVKELISLGDPVTFPPFFEETDEAILAKALDNRVGLFLMIEALRRAKPLADVYLSATVQEEVGLRGAYALAQKVKADAVLILEGTLAGDLPGIPPHMSLAACKKGPELRLTDARFVADRHFTLGLASLAKRKGIPYQIVVKNKGGTNASAFQIAGGAVRTAALSVPVRYIHGPISIAFKEDFKASCNLIISFLENPQEVLAYRWHYPSEI